MTAFSLTGCFVLLGVGKKVSTFEEKLVARIFQVIDMFRSSPKPAERQQMFRCDVRTGLKMLQLFPECSHSVHSFSGHVQTLDAKDNSH